MVQYIKPKIYATFSVQYELNLNPQKIKIQSHQICAFLPWLLHYEVVTDVP